MKSGTKSSSSRATGKRHTEHVAGVGTAKNLEEAAQKYARGSFNFNTSRIKEKSRRKTLEETKERIKHDALKTAETEILLPSDTGFIETDATQKVYSLKQKDIIKNVDLNTAKNAFDLQLTNFGPYSVNYTKNGRHLLFCGQKGHIATLDCLRTTVGMELQLQEELHHAQYLQNETMFAVAQQRYTYIYDSKGVEIHCMKRHERPYRLDYLPFHFLLTSIGNSGWIKWHDISIGEYVAGYPTGFGPCRVLKHNKANAVSHLGHSNGVVSLWSPAAGKALVSMFCHKAPVRDLAVDREGRYMATAGLDGLLKVWDLRKYSLLHSYRLDEPAVSLDISDTGLVGVALGRRVQVLQNLFTSGASSGQGLGGPGRASASVTYLTHELRTPNPALACGAGATASARALLSSVGAHSVAFRPLEDVLCVGHSHGVTGMIVPGAGEPNFDSFESNPFSTLRQRREAEVQTLLTKLSHESIALDADFVGTVEKDSTLLAAEQKAVFEAANAKELSKKKDKNRKRGRNKISAKLRRRQKNVVDAQLLKLKEKQAAQRAERESQGGAGQASSSSSSSIAVNLGALARFSKTTA